MSQSALDNLMGWVYLGAFWAIVAGVLLCVVAWTQPQWWRIGFVFLGIALATSGGAVRSTMEVTPGPTPGPPAPNPGPLPIPNTDFAERVKQSFNGPKAEGQIIGAIFDGLASTIGNDGAVDANLDGTLDPPVITDTRKLGLLLAAAQKSRVGNVTGWSTKYPAFEAAFVQEMNGRGINLATITPLDANKRTQAAGVFREVGQALGGS